MSLITLSTGSLLKSFFVFLISSCFGSFFKLVVDRYNTDKSFIFKGSHCNLCNSQLLWWHNIPVISFLILNGKCYFCKAKIDINCLYSELITGLVAVILYITKHESFIFLIFILLLLSMFDLKHRIIPHTITYTAITAFLVYQLVQNKQLTYSFLNLGIAFLFMDTLYILATLIKRFKIEINVIFIGVIVWSILFFFFQNIYFVIVPIIIYFASHKITIPIKLYVSFWILLIFLIILQAYKLTFVDFDMSKLALFFSGIGIIYFVCEVLFYFVLRALYSSQVNSSTTDQVQVFGGGDINVFALICVCLSYKIAFLTLFIASLLAIISHLTLRYLTRPLANNSQYIPFVPYLSLACFIIIMTINGR